MDLQSILCLSQTLSKQEHKTHLQNDQGKKAIYQYGRHKKPSRHSTELFVSSFEANFEGILQFLTPKEIFEVKLICRGIWYMYVVRELWTGMKLGVAEKKLEDFEDYEFVAEEKPKQITKEDKQIRIHSLKKSTFFVIVSDKVSINKRPSKRDASNIKQKKADLNVMQELNPAFQKTEIGFKRLLKTSNQMNRSAIKNQSTFHTNMFSTESLQIDIAQSGSLSIEKLPDLLQIPKQYTIDDLLINAKDQWVKNIHRANNLISVVSKWNSFHMRFWIFVAKEETDLVKLMKKMIKIDGCLMAYQSTIEEEPHHTICSILQGAEKNALIEEKLNKIGKEFMSSHRVLQELCRSKETERLIRSLHSFYQKTSIINSKSFQSGTEKDIFDHDVWADGLGAIQEFYDEVYIKNGNSKLKASLAESVFMVWSDVVKDHLKKCIKISQQSDQQNDMLGSLESVTLTEIVKSPEYFELVFQILFNIYSRLNTIANDKSFQPLAASSASFNVSNSFTKKNLLQKVEKVQLKQRNSDLNSTQKCKEQAAMYGVLWNLSKYFNKLQKQLAAKEKRRKDDPKVLIIKNFFAEEVETLKNRHICRSENFKELQSYYREFKAKIEKLKSEISKVS